MEKYKLLLDENNYVRSIERNGDIELDLSDCDLNYINAYQFINGKLTLDEEKIKKIKDKEKIGVLKQELVDTDYEAIKYSEGWFTDEEYAPIKAMREELREQIRALED